MCSKIRTTEGVEISIAGIPCLAHVTSYSNVPGMYSRNAPSDLDYYGYVDMEYDIHDRKGYPAPWLEKKLTDADREQIEIAIQELYDDIENAAKYGD